MSESYEKRTAKDFEKQRLRLEILRNKVKIRVGASEDDRLISYEFFKTEVCRRVLNDELAEIPRKKVLAYLKKEEKYIQDGYQSATSEAYFRSIHGKKAGFEKQLARFRNGDYLESAISGTVWGLGMMFE